MDIFDISYIDIDELGAHPFNWTDDANDADIDSKINEYFDKEKTIDLQVLNNEKKLTTEEEDTSMFYDDDPTYETDPETGEKIFRIVPLSSRPTVSLSNYNWVEEYLHNIESSSSSTSSNQFISAITLSGSDLFFEDISLSGEQTESNCFPKYISFEKSTNDTMLPNRFRSDQPIDDNVKQNFPQATSSTFFQLSNENNQDLLMDFLCVSIDDKHSTSSSSNRSRQQRLYSSADDDSAMNDSDIILDVPLVETKFEKIEYDEQSMPQMLVRRSSARRLYQRQQDENILRHHNIPLTLDDITQSSTEEYNRHLVCLNHLSPEQIHFIKDIRRRGKNKIAAQNCRKRKAINVETLLEEVGELKRVKYELENRKISYQQQIAETRSQYECLHRQVLPDRQLPPTIIVK